MNASATRRRAFGGPVPLRPHGYRLNVDVPGAVLLAEQSEVRISGVPVGKVTAVAQAPGARKRATIEIDHRYAPMHDGVRATLRSKTLFGEAYIEPGDRRKPILQEGTVLPRAVVRESVELDEIFRAFDPRTRGALRTWLQEAANATRGRGRDVNDAIGQLPGFAGGAGELLSVLRAQDEPLRGLVRDSGTVFEALAGRRGELGEFLRNGRQAFDAFARRSDELADAFRALPVFEREFTSLVRRTERFARDHDDEIDAWRDTARVLEPAMREVRAIGPDFKRLLTDIGPLYDAGREGLPAGQKVIEQARPLFGAFAPFLNQLEPILGYVNAYREDITGFVSNVTAATMAKSIPAGKESPTHYVRAMPMVAPEALSHYPRRLSTTRYNGYQPPKTVGTAEKPLRSWDTAHCDGHPWPMLADIPENTGTLADMIRTYVLLDGQEAAPPCLLQEPPPGGTRFPQLKPLRP